MENEQPNTIVVKSGGGMGIGGAVALIVIAGGAAYGINKLIKQGKENSAEAASGTPEGQIALQLKTVFDKFPVSDNEFKAAWLQVNATNKADVFKYYRALTQRNLSDDIASHISSGSQASATKIETYNSKPGKLFSITADNKIKFEIAPGDKIRFAPGQTTPITFFVSPFGIVLKEINNADLLKKLQSDVKTVASTVSVQTKPTARLFSVLAVKELPYEGIKKADDFYRYVRPFVNVKKTFAIVQIAYLNAAGKPTAAWIDARDMVTYKTTTKTVKGIGLIELVS